MARFSCYNLGNVTDVRQSQRPLSLTYLNGRCTIFFKEVSSNHQKKSVTKFVTDFGERFFFKEVSAKAQNPIWGGRLGPLGPGPPKLVLGFGTDFFENKSFTKVSDKFLTLTSFGDCY